MDSSSTQSITKTQDNSNNDKQVVPTTSFHVDGKVVTIPTHVIPTGSLLHVLCLEHNSSRVKKVDGVPVIDLTTAEWNTVAGILQSTVKPTIHDLGLVRYLQIPLHTTYGLSLIEEEYMRECMYQEGYEEDEFNTNPHYGLIKLTEELWNQLTIKPSMDDNLLYKEKANVNDNLNVINVRMIQPNKTDICMDSNTEELYIKNTIRDTYRKLLSDNTNRVNSQPITEIDQLRDKVLNAIHPPEAVNPDNTPVKQEGINEEGNSDKNDNNRQLPSQSDENSRVKDEPRLMKQSWSAIQEKLLTLNTLFTNKGISDSKMFIAGGKIFSILFNTASSDIDLFLYGQSEEEARKRVKEFTHNITAISNEDDNNYEIFRNNYWRQYTSADNYVSRIMINPDNLKSFLDKHPGCKSDYHSLVGAYLADQGIKYYRYIDSNVTRTGNAITYMYDGIQMQIILRLYRTPSEIIHGFDVDCCCMGYDGKDIWLTERCLYSLINAMNTVNFDRLSPSYEMRLAKYGGRGMAIRITNFIKANVDELAMEEFFNSWIRQRIETCSREYTKTVLTDEITGKQATYLTPRYDTPKPMRFYEHVKQLSGLSILLYLEYRHYRYNGKREEKTISWLCEETSDYSHIPYNQYLGKHRGSLFTNLAFFGEATAEVFNRTKNAVEIFKDLKDYYSRTFHDFFTNIFKSEHNRTNNDKPIPRSVMRSIKREWNKSRLSTNNVNGNSSFNVAFGPGHSADYVISIPDDYYSAMGEIMPWSIPADISFKVTNPGEQMTNTFHKLTLENNSVWYKSSFYTHNANCNN